MTYASVSFQRMQRVFQERGQVSPKGHTLPADIHEGDTYMKADKTSNIYWEIVFSVTLSGTEDCDHCIQWEK